MTPQNIVTGFSATGIMPYNPDTFQHEVYYSSNVTDNPLELNFSISAHATIN